MELRCSRDLALWLGAIVPESLDHHKEMKKAGHLLVRAPGALLSTAMFWPIATGLVALMRQMK